MAKYKILQLLPADKWVAFVTPRDVRPSAGMTARYPLIAWALCEVENDDCEDHQEVVAVIVSPALETPRLIYDVLTEGRWGIIFKRDD